MKVLAYGEIMLRLATEGVITDNAQLTACYGGTESNVLACLCKLGHDTEYITALPDSELGRETIKHLHRYGVGTSHVKIAGDMLGIYFVQTNNASRGSSVVYQRKHSEFTRISENDVDFDKVFEGVDLFHVSGISYALSDSSRKLGFRLLEEANARGITVSFDFNYRSRLWSVCEARPILLDAASHADILLASTLDLNTFICAEEKDVFRLFPHCKYLSLRDRHAVSNTEHVVKVKLLSTSGAASIKETKFDVKENIGGGDAYDGCLLDSLMTGATIDDAVRFATAGFILKHQQKGDTFLADRAEISAFAKRL